MEQKIQDNNNKISELKKSKKLLKRGLRKQEKFNELKTKENNELKNKIKKLTKSNIEFGRLPTLFQDIEKKDNKDGTFALADIDKENFEKLIDNKEIPEDFDIDEKNEYLDINLSDVNNLFYTVKKNIEKKIIDIGDNKSINFNDIIDFSKDIIDGKINNFNKEKKYNEKFKDIEKNLENKKKDTNDIKLYIFYLNRLKKILFTSKKSSGTPTKIPQIVRKRDNVFRIFFSIR